MVKHKQILNQVFVGCPLSVHSMRGWNSNKGDGCVKFDFIWRMYKMSLQKIKIQRITTEWISIKARNLHWNWWPNTKKWFFWFKKHKWRMKNETHQDVCCLFDFIIVCLFAYQWGGLFLWHENYFKRRPHWSIAWISNSDTDTSTSTRLFEIRIGSGI